MKTSVDTLHDMIYLAAVTSLYKKPGEFILSRSKEIRESLSKLTSDEAANMIGWPIIKPITRIRKPFVKPF
jgi:hypothetical protein